MQLKKKKMRIDFFFRSLIISQFFLSDVTKTEKSYLIFLFFVLVKIIINEIILNEKI